MNKNDLKNQINLTIPSGIVGAVSAEDVRSSINSVIDNSLFPEDLASDVGESTTTSMSQKAISDKLAEKISDTDLAGVAKTGDYNDLINTPVVPSTDDFVTNEEFDAIISPIETKLSTISEGAEINIQPDWNEEDITSDAFIQNKPVIPSIDGLATVEYVEGEVATLETKLNTISEGAEVNVQSDWDEADNTSDAFIQNKPIIPSIDGLATVDQLNTGLASKADSSNVYTKVESDTLVATAVAEVARVDAEIAVIETKLESIATGAEVNVQSNWSETDNTSDAFILNKPTIPSIDGLATVDQLNTGLASKADSSNVYTKAESDAALDLKADSSVVEGIDTRLEAAENSVSTLEGYISSPAITSITAEDNSVAVGGTSTAPTLKVKLDKSATTGNVVFEVTDEGLKANVNISQFQTKVVDALPSIGESLYYYLVKTATENLYREYVWAEVEADIFEFVYLGDTNVDLADYVTNEELTAALLLKADLSAVYTKSEIDTALGLKANSASTYSKTDVDTLLTGKLDVADGYTKAELDAKFNLKANESEVDALSTKLESIATGAEVNVQSDWNESDNTSDAFIQNKPVIPSIDGLATEDYVHANYVDYPNFNQEMALKADAGYVRGQVEALAEDIATKQDILISDVNIKTINDNSILGSGNLRTVITNKTSLVANKINY